MRFKFTLERIENNVLPINYQYELYTWIHKVINFSNKDFTGFLKLKGYAGNGKTFDFFTFSRLNFPSGEYKIAKDRIILKAQQFDLKISLIMNETVEPFIVNLFQNQHFILGDRKSKVKIKVKNVERMPDPKWKEKMTFITHSPIVLGMVEENNNKTSVKYLEPGAEEYENLFFQNLLNKYISMVPFRKDLTYKIKPDAITNFKLLNKPKAKLVKIKADTADETFIKGYDFDFKITAPVELIKIGYFAGFGDENCFGFGCAEKKQ
jgi:CRISPR-associated endoribonuclease Cas6